MPQKPQAQRPAAYPRLRTFFNSKLGMVVIVGVFACLLFGGIISFTAGNSAHVVPTPTSQIVQLHVTPTLRTEPTTRLAVATPTPRPTPALRPTPTPCPSPCNPWGFSFSPRKLIYSPPSAFCSFFPCVGNFWNGSGYIIECNDGMYSLSGGGQGACSDHSGAWRALYSHWWSPLTEMLSPRRSRGESMPRRRFPFTFRYAKHLQGHFPGCPVGSSLTGQVINHVQQIYTLCANC